MNHRKHTKGPWKATNTLLVPWGSEHAQACLIESITEDKPLAIVILEGPFESDVLEDEGEANAHLIAAAPEMLKTLETLFKSGGLEKGSELHHQVFCLIKKAKGE